jgi:hypothetical protein
MRIRILKLPPTNERLEGFDVSRCDFIKGESVDVPTRLAEVLLLWNYAAPERRREARERHLRHMRKNPSA